jgi:hypothetical protein
VATLPRLRLLGLAQLQPPQHDCSRPGSPGSGPRITLQSPRRGVGGGAVLLLPSPPLSPPPPLSAVEQGKGENPKWLVGSSRGSASGCRRPVTGSARAKMPQRVGIGCTGEEGDVAALQWPEELLMPWFQGQRCLFPPGGFPRRVRVRSDSASKPVGRCGRRRGGKRRGERDKVTDWWSQAVGKRRRKEKGSVVVGLLGRTTGSARKALVGWLTDLGRKPAQVRC